MALGKPAITAPNALELRAIANAISAARQRIEALESVVSAATGSATSVASTTSQQINTLRSQLASLAARVAVLENASAIDTVTLIAAEDIAKSAPVVPSSATEIVNADASDPFRMFGVLGLATEAGAPTNSIVVQRRGPYTIAGASFIPHRAVYVGEGGITQVPEYEATAIPLGVAISADTIYIAPDWPALRGPVFDSSVGDAFTRYLPVTASMLEDLLPNPITLPPFGSGSIPDEALLTAEYAGEFFQVSIADLRSLFA